MKKTLLSLHWLLINTTILYSQAIRDTVSIGAGYANQVWYSLENNEQGSAPKNNWDLAFDVSAYGSSISINSVNGVNLWLYPHGNATAWSSVDTSGYTSWNTKRWNSDTSWTYGAFDRYRNTSNPFDLGWGIYSPTTHVVTGDSIYIIKLANGQFRKLMIQSLASGTYTFKYANIDGSNEQTTTITKSAYSTKNLVYYSIQNNTIIDREPASANWDLCFTQYSAYLSSTFPAYTVTGVLHNKGIKAAKAHPVPDSSTYTNYSAHTFKTAINTIGYDWKYFAGGTFRIEDSTVYFIRRTNGDIWKLYFVGFGGSANGNSIFVKQKLNTSTTSIIKDDLTTVSSFALYPNPASSSEKVNLIYDLNISANNIDVFINDLSGNLVHQQKLLNTSDLNVYQLELTNLSKGMYIVTFRNQDISLQQKLIIH
ncbi:MAG: T9SS type A sorting domain-containing protein [Cytophagaceae bacterium]|nr:T9SS type A sorting domain-containing protein [Cytophagaceae bacterium]MDW8455713.1 T9SS type A sorting domain-containing protein [Cytophagaceae bacterium]